MYKEDYFHLKNQQNLLPFLKLGCFPSTGVVVKLCKFACKLSKNKPGTLSNDIWWAQVRQIEMGVCVVGSLRWGPAENQYFKNVLKRWTLWCSRGWQGSKMKCQLSIRENKYLFQSPGVRQNVLQHQAAVGQTKSADPESELCGLYLTLAWPRTNCMQDLEKERNLIS